VKRQIPSQFAYIYIQLHTWMQGGDNHNGFSLRVIWISEVILQTRIHFKCCYAHDINFTVRYSRRLRIK